MLKRAVAFWICYAAAAVVGIVLPIALFLSSFSGNDLIQNSTTVAAPGFLDNLWWRTVLPFIILAPLLFGFLMLLQRTVASFGSLGSVILRLMSPYVGGIVFPALLASMLYFGAVAIAMYLNGDQACTANPNGGFDCLSNAAVLQTMFPIYLTVFSVAAVLQSFYLFNSVQTRVFAFLHNLTSDLRPPAKEKSGDIVVSLPWLAYGYLTITRQQYIAYEKALVDCLNERGVKCRIFCASMDEIDEKLQASVDEGHLSKEDAEEFRQKEIDLRDAASVSVNSSEFDEISWSDVKSCILLSEKLYLLNTLLEQAMKDGNIGNAFLAMRITDPAVRNSYATIFKK